MGRNVKEYDSRKTELIEAASQLIYSIGYQETTVEKIHQQVGVSKGAFYHYFKTKEEIIDAVIEREIIDSLSELDQVLNDPKANTPARLSMFFRFMRNWKVTDMEKIREYLSNLYADSNVYIRHRNRVLTSKLASEILGGIISAGTKNGFFRAVPSNQLTDFVMRLGFELNDAVAELVIGAHNGTDISKQIENTVSLFQDALEKVLGAPGGSIRMINRDYLKNLLKP
jgi:AcrR family transcriptional regulator